MEIKHKIAGGLIAVSLMAPAFALAALPVRTSTTTPTAVNFCTNLPNLTTQVNTRISANEKNLESRQQQRQTQVQERQTKREQQLGQIRTNGDQDRQAIYQQLMAKATTEEQKQAVTAFQNAIEAAVTTRRTAVDAALKTYWAALDSALAARRTAVATARQNFSASIQAALTTASTQCSSGVAPATVRKNFQASLEAAKTQFATNRKAIDKIGPQVKTIVQTRNAAVKKAMTDFKATAEQARTELKAAFGK